MIFQGEGSRLRAELAELRAEAARLRRTNDALRQQQATDAAIIAALRRQVQTLETIARQAAAALPPLQQQVAALQATLAATQAALAAAQAQLAAAALPPPAAPAAPPDWVKPQTPARPPAARRKRAAQHNHARPREEPTRVVPHHLDTCPDCGTPLTSPRLRHTRQVLEIPPPPPVEVIEHQVWAGYCPQCHRWHEPSLDLTGQVVGQERIGVRLTSLLATLRYQARLPLDLIQALLQDLWGVHLSHGGVVGVLHRLRRLLEPAFQALLAQARASPVLHMDETGWREEGANGYIWELATGGASPVRLYMRDPSRAGAVRERVLDGQFQGVLVCDLYGGYNGYTGVIQRCWVHFLRDLHKLKETYPTDAAVKAWADAVTRLYRVGKEYVRRHPAASEEARAAAYAKLVTAARTTIWRRCDPFSYNCYYCCPAMGNNGGSNVRLGRRLPTAFPDNLVLDVGCGHDQFPTLEVNKEMHHPHGCD